MFFCHYFFSCWKQMLSVICCCLSLPTPGLPQQPQWTGRAWGSTSWQKSPPAHRTRLSAVLRSGIGTGVTQFGFLVLGRTICEKERGQEKRGGKSCLLILRLERLEGWISLPRENFPWHRDGKISPEQNSQLVPALLSVPWLHIKWDSGADKHIWWDRTAWDGLL